MWSLVQGRLLMALMAEEVPARLAPKIKQIGPCSDPIAEPFVIRFDLYQASQLDDRSVPDNTQVQIELQVIRSASTTQRLVSMLAASDCHAALRTRFI